jgi:hypothetical protein
MKGLILIGFVILLMVFTGCENKEKREVGLNRIEEKNMTEENAVKAEKEETKTEVAAATFEEKVQDGKIIPLTNNGEPEPYKFFGTEIKAMQLPDGKFYQVEIEDDNTVLIVPGHGKMQLIKLNEKFYVFDDDDQAYEIKVVNNELVAEATYLTDVLLSMK